MFLSVLTVGHIFTSTLLNGSLCECACTLTHCVAISPVTSDRLLGIHNSDEKEALKKARDALSLSSACNKAYCVLASYTSDPKVLKRFFLPLYCTE